MAAVAEAEMWSQLMGLTQWTLLSRSGLHADHVEDVLYRVDKSAFLLCTPYDGQLRPLGRDVAVAAIVWAESEGAARRAVLQQLEADEARDVQPPAAVLLRPGVERYAEIRETARTGRFGSMLQAASYRNSDGLFVDRRINLPRWTFHFRNREDNNFERCYAVQVRLASERETSL